MDTYQKDTDFHKDLIRLTVDEESTVITKLSGQHKRASVNMTHHQAHQISQFLKEGLQQFKGRRTYESNEAVNTLCHLLNALETLQSIDPRALAIPDIAEKWKQALQQGWQAHRTLSSMLEDWQETLSVSQRSADETLEKEEASKSGVGPRF